MFFSLYLGDLTKYNLFQFHQFICRFDFSLLWNKIVYVHLIFFIHYPVEGQLGCFYFLVFVKTLVGTMTEQVHLWWDIKSFQCMPGTDVFHSHSISHLSSFGKLTQ